jgi:nucleoside-diphosphate-sugar epimerase
MNIFITGASGFVGSRIVETLGKKYEFHAMARSEKSAQKVTELGAKAVLCELGALRKEHLAGCDMIIHAAAFTKEWGTRTEFFETTVDGTKQLLETAKEAGVKRFLHISTEAVLFAGQDLNDIDESYPYPNKSKFLYSESKLEAEKPLLSRVEQNREFRVLL